MAKRKDTTRDIRVYVTREIRVYVGRIKNMYIRKDFSLYVEPTEGSIYTKVGQRLRLETPYFAIVGKFIGATDSGIMLEDWNFIRTQ